MGVWEGQGAQGRTKKQDWRPGLDRASYSQTRGGGSRYNSHAGVQAAADGGEGQPPTAIGRLKSTVGGSCPWVDFSQICRVLGPGDQVGTHLWGPARHGACLLS